VQLSVVVTGPLATAKLPLAATLPSWSLTAQFTLSADGALVVKASWNVLPDANIRVASALGVSADIRALLAAVLELVGDWQDIVSPALVLAVSEVLAVPLELVPLLVLVPLLLTVALVPLDPLPDPPPPPQPASISSNEESNNE
jgi:hypothetical protein